MSAVVAHRPLANIMYGDVVSFLGLLLAAKFARVQSGLCWRVRVLECAVMREGVVLAFLGTRNDGHCLCETRG